MSARACSIGSNPVRTARVAVRIEPSVPEIPSRIELKAAAEASDLKSGLWRK